MYFSVLQILMSTSTTFTDYVFKSLPNGQNNPYSHLSLKQPVAITVDGLQEHNDHHAFGKLAAAAGVGALALGTSGLGFGVVGSLGAFGVGAVELAVVGTGIGAGAGLQLNKGLRFYGKAEQFKDVKALPVVGIVEEFSKHWFDDQCNVVRVTWYVFDNNGVLRPRTDWHLPHHLIGMELRSVAEQRDAEEAARRAKPKVPRTTTTAAKSNSQNYVAPMVALAVVLSGLTGFLSMVNSTTTFDNAPIERVSTY